jgi:hypothetical protein
MVRVPMCFSSFLFGNYPQLSSQQSDFAVPLEVAVIDAKDMTPERFITEFVMLSTPGSEEEIEELNFNSNTSTKSTFSI